MDKVVECQIEKYARMTAQGREWESMSNSPTRPLVLILTKSGVLKVEAGRVLLEYWDLRLAKDVRTHRRAHNLLFLCNTKGAVRKWRVMFAGEPPAAEERCVRCLRAIQAFLTSPITTPHLYPHTLTNIASLPLVPHSLANRITYPRAFTDTVPRPHSLTDAPLRSLPASLDVPPFVGVQARYTTSLLPEFQPHTSPHPSPAGVNSDTFPHPSPQGSQPHTLSHSSPAGVQPNTLPYPSPAGVQSHSLAPIVPTNSAVPLVYTSTMPGSTAGQRDSLVSTVSSSSHAHTLSLPACATVIGTAEANYLPAGGRKAKLTPHKTPVSSGHETDTQGRDPATQSHGSDSQGHDPSIHVRSSDTQVRDSDTQVCDPDTQNRETDTQFHDQDTQGRDPDSKVHDTNTQGRDLNTQDSEGSIIIDPENAGHSTGPQNTDHVPVLQCTGQAHVQQSSGHTLVPENAIFGQVLLNAGHAPSVAALGPSPSLEQLVRAVLEDPVLPDVVDAVYRVIANM